MKLTPRILRTGALAAALLAFSSCPAPPPSGNDGGVEPGLDRVALLGGLGECALFTYEQFVPKAEALEAAVAAWDANPDATTLAAARTAWEEAIDAWQRADLMRFGPAAPSLVPGGQDLRDFIYSWALVSRCGVEETLVSKGYEGAGFDSLLVARRGLDALEYLLFYEGEDTACPATSPIVSDGTWAALSSSERAARKRAYAVAASADVAATAGTLVDAWREDGGDFLGTLRTAGPDNPVYESRQGALNMVSDSMFLLESVMRDMKVGRPVGVRDCFTDTCPEELESQYAHRSKQHLLGNLESFERMMFGCGDAPEPLGFDDLLVSIDAGDVAERMRDRVDGVRTAIEAIEEPDLAAALSADKASVVAVYDALKGVTDVLKTELVTVLDLELPMTLEGDND